MNADQIAAHQLLCDLRTRIATQPLPYQHGAEGAALESLFAVFEQSRAAMRNNPGCTEFARIATHVLNTQLRPVTAKWHRALLSGELASRDGADEFRGELEEVQKNLRQLVSELQTLAYGKATEDSLAPPALTQSDLERYLQPLAFGVIPPAIVDPHSTAEAERARAIQGLNEDEAAAIRERRRKGELAPVMNAVGLALSGGGIRSATFSLGVVQVLAETQLLDNVDVLSTVSGGGYTGSFLTTTLVRGNARDRVGQPFGPDTADIAKLRANAKYLTSSNLWETWSRVAATVAGMFLNWTVPIVFIVAAALLAASTEPFFPNPRQWHLIIAGLASGSLLAAIVYGVLMHYGARASNVGGVLLGGCLALTACAGLLWAVVSGHAAAAVWLDSLPSLSVAVAGLAGLGPSIVRFVPIFKKPGARLVALRTMLLIAGLVVPVVFLGLFYACWDLGMMQWDGQVVPIVGTLRGTHILTTALILLGIVAVFVVDINQTSPHRLYRNALAKTFINTSRDAFSQINGMTGDHRAPYHLVNTTVNLPSSRDPQLRDRKGDFFIFSKHWSGSLTTGYYPTPSWQFNGQSPDLKTAMAISGAAASSHMGLLSKPTLSALITLLNVRLGFWIQHPKRARGFRFPGFTCLLKEMFGRGMDESATWLNLSDGGHIENTGCYELLRRRCKFVIAVDGEADPSLGFSGLLTLTRHAQVNLGIRIDLKLDELRADAASGYSRRHSLLCRVHYPDRTIGLLLYLKSSLTGNESELIRGYRKANAAFPHQSTLDQFFDEEQFEAYRQLGVHVAQGLFSRALVGPDLPNSVAGWFGALAPKMLEPEGEERALRRQQ